jgi:hypothetical protein
VNPLFLLRLREEVADRVRSWKSPEVPALELRDRNDFFLATSSLQKAIRRNLETEAMTYASALARQYSRYLAWRLAVVALEDVGHGALGLVEQATLIASEPELRERLGTERTLVWLAGQLAAAPGDRSACELVVAAAGHPILRDDLIGMRSRAELLRGAANPTVSPADAVRIAASVAELDRRGWFDDALAAVADRVGPRVLWIGETAHRISVEGLEHGFVASALLVRGRTRDAADEALSTERVGPWLAPALDQHTRSGIRAIERFALRCQQLATVLRVVTQRCRARATGSLVFAAEGGLLSRSVAHPGVTEFARWDSEASLASAGALIHILDEGLEAVRANLAQLNEIRAEMLRWRTGEPG